MIGLVILLAIVVALRIVTRRRQGTYRAASTDAPGRVTLSYREASFPCGCHFKDGTVTACEAHVAIVEASR